MARHSAPPLVPNPIERVRVAVTDCMIVFLHFGGLILLIDVYGLTPDPLIRVEPTVINLIG